ncbi:MAG: hypothetical protein IJK04_09815 [Kiritimatiellae bacterium]|nr:hypothetical protein [Kiritimatiellia bacterium]
MAVTPFQAEILRLIARNRVANGETYVAGGLALNYALHRPRVSHDIDVFNDTYEAMVSSADMDRETLKKAGYNVETMRDRDFIVEAKVSRNGATTDIQWVRDSAYRFFPIVEDELLGYTLHPLDLATNKLLALAGRQVPRDWIDTISCADGVQPLVYLAWAANGKDPGLSPRYIIEMGARTHYTQGELEMAVLTDEMLDVAELSRKWHSMIAIAREVLPLLPPEEVGKAVLDKEGRPFKGDPKTLPDAIAAGEVVFHEGRICGAWPRVL